MSKIDELIKSLTEFKEHLQKDAVDEKIKAKLRAEMDKRGFGDKQVADHQRDTDETIPAAQRSNIKNSLKIQNQPKPKLTVVKGEECYKVSERGQWSIEKSNAVKPFGANVYDSTANINRKATRTGEERPEMGRNQGVRQYTTSGSSMAQAHEKAQIRDQNAKTKASTRTFADMTDEEKAEMKAKYEKPLAKGADVVKEALTTGNLPVVGDAKPQPTNEQMFGHLVKTEEEVKAVEEHWENGIKRSMAGLDKPIDHLNKSTIDTKWGYGKSFNSLLKEKLSDKEIAERNMHYGEE